MDSVRSFGGPALALLPLMLALAGTATAQSPADRPLPDAMVTTSDGSQASIRTMASSGQWIIVYLHATSPASERLLEALDTWDLGSQASILVIVGNVADAAPLAVNWSARLPDARFTADPSNRVLGALQLRGAPSVLGVRGQSIVWVLAGVLNDPTMLRDVVTSWVK